MSDHPATSNSRIICDVEVDGLALDGGALRMLLFEALVGDGVDLCDALTLGQDLGVDEALLLEEILHGLEVLASLVRTGGSAGRR